MPKSFSDLLQEVRACLWSCDPDKLDRDRDREEIITQVLNYGTWRSIKWLQKNYDDKEILEVLKKPARGRWFKQCLNFWLLQFNLKLPPEIYRRAIFNIHPSSGKIT